MITPHKDANMPQVDWVQYTSRESRRAKRVILKISVTRGLEVVLPHGYDKRRLPNVLESKKDWIERNLKRVSETRKLLVPGEIDLQAIGLKWQVSYQQDPESKLNAREMDDQTIRIQGDKSDVYGVAEVLRKWLHLKARAHLTPWLHDVSDEIGVSFQKTTIRGQATRWASCSQRKTISLNRTLLFLPRNLVRHVFLHELCHLQHLNHSPTFWSVLGDLEPSYKDMEAEIKRADRFVPTWAHPR